MSDELDTTITPPAPDAAAAASQPAAPAAPETPAAEPTTEQKLRSMFGTTPDEATAPRRRRSRAAKQDAQEIPTGEELSPEIPETKAKAVEPVKPVEPHKPVPPAQPAIDSATLRRAQNYGLDMSDYADDLPGLIRTLRDLDRQAAEIRLKPAVPEKKNEELPPSDADALVKSGYAEDDPLVLATRAREQREAKAAERIAALESRLEKNAESERQRRQAQLYAEYEGAVEKLDAELYGSGDPEKLSEEAFQARQKLFPHVMRIGRSYAESDIPMPSFQEVVEEAHRAVNRARFEDGIRKSYAKEFNARRGTQQIPPAPKDGTKPAVKKTGREAAIEELNELIETTPELQSGGWETSKSA